MICPNCGDLDPDEVIISAHCGIPRAPEVAGKLNFKPTLHSSQTSSGQSQPSHTLIKHNWFIAVMVGLPLLCSTLVEAIAGLVLVQTGTFSLCRSGNNY